jgi:tungstate transport system substrate-binding protein
MRLKLKKKIKITESEEEEIKIKFKSKKRKALFIASALLITGFIGTYTFLEFVQSQHRIILATTTSTYDSGLLDEIIPVFERQYRITVEVLSVGTGQALETGEKGDADVILVHAREKEDDFVDDDYGVHRVCVMYNDFIIVGPESDPANVNGVNASRAMKKLKEAGNRGSIKFYSRGDDSGTHHKELKLWELIGFDPDTSKHDWYLETGTGMGNTLTIANDNGGYTIVDRGTWLSRKDKVDLSDFVSGETILLNPYGAIIVDSPAAKYEYAKTFVSFLVSEEGQELIKDFRKNGEILFKPAYSKCDETHSCQTTDEEMDYWEDYVGNYNRLSTDLSLITKSINIA